MTENKSEFVEIAALWKSTSKAGRVYYSGSLGRAKIYLFEIESDNERAPVFRVCLKARDDDEQRQSNGEGDHA